MEGIANQKVAVQRGLADPFSSRFAARLQKLQIGCNMGDQLVVIRIFWLISVICVIIMNTESFETSYYRFLYIGRKVVIIQSTLSPGAKQRKKGSGVIIEVIASPSSNQIILQP